MARLWARVVSSQRQNWRNSSSQKSQREKRYWKPPECMYPPQMIFTMIPNTNSTYSIYLVHDDAKEKEFELEMSWISTESGGHHVAVPQDLFDEAEAKAKAALENFE